MSQTCAGSSPPAAAPAGDTLTFAITDLTSDNGWPEAVNGCEYVLHVASPFPAAGPEHEEDVIVPARDGTLRVLRAAHNAGVKRVVVTSSFAAIGYGHGTVDRAFTEEDWTNLAGEGVTAYVKSKMLAERAAWDLTDNQGGATELTVVHPVAIFGPVLSHDLSTSIVPILTLITAGYEQMANISFSLAGVRDVRRHPHSRNDPSRRRGGAFHRLLRWRPHHDAGSRRHPAGLDPRSRRHQGAHHRRCPASLQSQSQDAARLAPTPDRRSAARDRTEPRPHRPSPGSVIAAQTVVLIGSMLSTNERLTAKSIDLKPFSLRSSRRGRWSGG